MTNLTNIDELVNEIYESTKKIDGYTEQGKALDLKEIRGLVEPIINLINEATEKKKYIYLGIKHKWFSPFELEMEFQKGWYVYHVTEFELREPTERLEELEKEILDKRKELTKILKEMSSYIGINERELELDALKRLVIKEKAIEPERME